MNKLLTFGMFCRQGMKAFNDGRHMDALFQLSQAEMLAHQIKKPVHLAQVWNNIGLVQMTTGEKDKALAHFLKAAEAAVTGAGTGNVLHRAILRNMEQLEQAAA